MPLLELQNLVDNGNLCVPSAIYQQLAEKYYRKKEYRKGFEILVQELEKFGTESSYESLKAYRSLHTSEEIEDLRKIIRACAMQFPATMVNTKNHALFFGHYKEKWFDEHIKLAEIEEQNMALYHVRRRN